MLKYSSILLITPILYLFYYNILILDLLCGSICIFLFSFYYRLYPSKITRHFDIVSQSSYVISYFSKISFIYIFLFLYLFSNKFNQIITYCAVIKFLLLDICNIYSIIIFICFSVSFLLQRTKSKYKIIYTWLWHLNVSIIIIYGFNYYSYLDNTNHILIFYMSIFCYCFICASGILQIPLFTSQLNYYL